MKMKPGDVLYQNQPEVSIKVDFALFIVAVQRAQQFLCTHDDDISQDIANELGEHLIKIKEKWKQMGKV